ncbi:hypothetical protein OIU84_019245 [Salix udensis]|uniref:Uncharacterized protein n=1 Tax=Salix udensis TaxID=889485 RepID=A0AAD6L086_9ROSI|nr:hypothetical protein OIU84_019245 [Salix udensis]
MKPISHKPTKPARTSLFLQVQTYWHHTNFAPLKGRGAKRDESGRMINHIAYSEQLRRDKTGNHTAVIIIADEKKQHGKTPVDKDIIISISDSDEEMDAETLIIEQNLNQNT